MGSKAKVIRTRLDRCNEAAFVVRIGFEAMVFQ